MASVRLLKDRSVKVDGKDTKQKVGEIVSVPFLKSREMVAAGEAEHLVPPGSSKADGSPPTKSVSEEVFLQSQRQYKAEIENSAGRIAFLEGEVRRLADENAVLVAEIDKATKPEVKK